MRQTGRVVTKNACALGGVMAGAKLGAAVGTATCPVWGTAVGILAGILGGFLAGKCATSLYDNMFPNGEEAARKQCIRDALQYFHFQQKDLKSSNIFNSRELTRRFKRFAMDAHPDRRNGNPAEWQLLSQHYGLLKGLCNETNDTKKMVDKAIK